MLEIGEKLKNARISCGYTQEQVAEKVNCANRYLAQLESNQSAGSISLIINLCNLYKISLDYLYSDYLNINSPSDLAKISGYFNLKSDYKNIVENNISYLNKLQLGN